MASLQAKVALALLLVASCPVRRGNAVSVDDNGGSAEPVQAEAKAATRCVEGSRSFPWPLPGEEGSSAPVLVRATLPMDEAHTVLVRETRSDPTEAPDSEIIVKGPRETQRFLIPQLIRGGRGLRLLEAATLCNGDEPTFIIGFEKGWTGAAQGFVIFTRTHGAIRAHAFPPVRQGALVIRRRDLRKVELWSAAGHQACDACVERYKVRDCEWKTGNVRCTERKRQYRSLSSDSVADGIIRIE